MLRRGGKGTQMQMDLMEDQVQEMENPMSPLQTLAPPPPDQNLISNESESCDESEPSDNISTSDLTSEIVPNAPNTRRAAASTQSKQTTRSNTPSPSPTKERTVATVGSSNDRIDRISNFRKQTDSKPSKSFDEHVRHDQKKGILPTQEKKTLDDFEKKPRKKTDESTQLPLNLMFVVAAVVLVICLLGVWVYQNTEEGNSNPVVTAFQVRTPEVKWKTLQKSLLSKFMKLNSRYTHQLSATNTHLLSAVNSTFDVSEPRQPSAITLLIPPSLKSSSFPKCFALKYASAVNEIFAQTWNEKYQQQGVKVVNSEYFRVNGGNITGIHEDLKHYFSVGGKVVVVEDVDKLHKEEHFLVFHSFCDNFKAPHKRATFMFLLDVPDSIADKYSWNYSEVADISYSALDEAWTATVSEDHRAAMIARVAATVVLLKDGDSC